MDEPALSVVLVTYNSRREIGPCLESIFTRGTLRCGNPAGEQREVVVVDNASRDETLRLVRSMVPAGLKHGVEVRWVENDRNLGFTRAVNQGLAQARGGHVMLLNPDTRLLPGALESLHRRLNRDPGIGIIAPQLLNADGSIQPTCRAFPDHRDVLFELTGLSRLFPQSATFNRWRMGGFSHQTEAWDCQPQGACMLLSRRTLDIVGPLDERFVMFFSDVDLCLEVLKAGLRVLYWPEAKVQHAKGASVYRHRAAMIRISTRDFIAYFQKQFTQPRYWLLNGLAWLLLVWSGLVRMTVELVR